MCMAERGFTSFELDGVMKSSEKGMAEVKRNVEIRLRIVVVYLLIPVC